MEKIQYGDLEITLKSEPKQAGKYEWRADGVTQLGQEITVIWNEPVSDWAHPTAIQPKV